LAAACATRPDTPERAYCDRKIAGGKTDKKRWPHGEPPSSESSRTGIAPRQTSGEAELVSVGVGQVEVPLAPYAVAGRRLR